MVNVLLHALYKPDQQQQDDRADCSIDNRACNAVESEAETRQQPARQERADDADDDVSDHAESISLDHHAGKPSGNRTHDEPYDEGFDRYILLPNAIKLIAPRCALEKALDGSCANSSV
jgi:hypothetical protein